MEQHEKPFKVGLYLTVILLVAGIIWVRAATPPDTISYQGVLTDTSGKALTGNYNMNVAFYDAATGGTNPYAEGHANVTVSRGQFDLELGAGTPTVGTWGALDFSQALWMEITAGGETFAPRIPLSAVPYARFAFKTGALAANGANCTAGQAPLGVDDSGAVEGCFDVATQTELDTHSNLTTAHGATSSNTASRIVMRDGSGNFSAGTITANLTGNASTATALAANGSNCAAGNYPLGVDASGNVEGCTAAGGGSITINRYSASISFTANAETEGYVACTSGSPIGGGFDVPTSSQLEILASCPATDAATCTTSSPTGWRVRAFSAAAVNGTIYVICAQ